MVAKPRLAAGDKIGLIACSDGLPESERAVVDVLAAELEKMGLRVELAATVFRRRGPFSGTPKERAAELMRLFSDEEIKAVFDISGGDAANQVLPYLDFKAIGHSGKPFFGWSDLSVLLNAISKCADLVTYHYQLRQIVWDKTGEQRRLFCDTFLGGVDSLFDFDYKWLRGEATEGRVVGGNIRCFSKLAGTPYFPETAGKLLFLEAWSGKQARIASYLAQLKQLGVFEKVTGVILGTFTELEKEMNLAEVEEMFLEALAEYSLPVLKSQRLGHGVDARCLRIGDHYSFRRSHSSQKFS